MTVKRIHHINFIVENLEESIVRYEKILGANVFERDDLPQRGVVTARAKIGEQWFVLVQPVDFDLPPGKHLLDKGEGFFLMSFEVGSMEDAISDLDSKGISFTTNSDQKGLSNWWVRDIDKKATSGEQLQLCEERA